jgi:hypothetical protein
MMENSALYWSVIFLYCICKKHRTTTWRFKSAEAFVVTHPLWAIGDDNHLVLRPRAKFSLRMRQGKWGYPLHLI